MTDKFDQVAERFPEEYRDRITEMLRLKADTDSMNEQMGRKIYITLEQYTERLAEDYGTIPAIARTRPARSRNLDRDLATAQRVNDKLRRQMERPI